MDVRRAITTRRSVGRVKPDPVPKEKVEEILESAIHAPNHKITEPWRFHVFSGKGRGELAKARAETARLIAEAGAYLVPTLVTYEALSEEGLRYGVPEENIRKIDEARASGIRALRYAHEAGVRIASGSDLLGPLQDRKARELEIKTEVMSPMKALVSATRTNAGLFGMEGEIGTVEEGKLADLLVVEGNPLEDIAVLQNRDNLKLIMKGGRVVKNRLA